MSVAPTINEQVAQMHAARGCEPADGAMATFGRYLATYRLPAGVAEVGR